MVLQVLADAGQVVDDRNPDCREVARRADTGDLQEVRRVDGAAADDDLARRQFPAIGAALALRRGLHFGLGLVLPVHGRLGRHLIAAFVGVVVLVSSLFLAAIAAQMVARTWQSSYATLPVPHGVAYVGLLVGAVLMMIFAVEQSVLHAAGPEVAA